MIQKRTYIVLIIIVFFVSSRISAQSEINKDSLSDVIKLNNEDIKTVKALNNLSEYYLYQDIDSSEFFGKQALELSKKISYQKGIAESYRSIGRTNTISGHYKESLDCFYNALKINEVLHDSVGLGECYEGIGIIHYYQGEIDKALVYCEKAIEIFKIQNYLSGLSRVYNNIGLIYFDYNKLDTAQIYFDKTIKIAKITKDKKIEISALGNLARIFSVKEEFKKAIEKFYELNEKINPENDKSTLSVSYSNIALAYLNLAKKETNKSLKNKYVNKAVENNFIALKIADQLNSNSLRSYAFQGLKEAYKEKKDFKNAFKSLEKYQIINDSIFNQKKTEAIASIEEKYENDKKQIQIENLQKEKQADLKLIQKKNTIILIVIIGFLIVLILSLFLYKLYRAKKHALILLDEKNKDILVQKEEIAAQRDKISEIAFELKKANRTKNKLFSIIAHDLKNPFQGIIGFSEMIKEDAEKQNLNKIKKFAEYIFNVSEQTYKLLDNLLNFTRNQIGLIKYNPEIINIKEIVEEGIILVQSTAEVKGVKLIDETNHKHTAYADESMISTVIRNLISNAVKFTSEGGYVKVQTENSNDKVVIKIIDCGVGIKEDDISKLFKADLNFTTFGTENEKGTGLGLVVCKDFAVKNGGTITVKSEVGKGSTFTVTLPANK